MPKEKPQSYIYRYQSRLERVTRLAGGAWCRVPAVWEERFDKARLMADRKEIIDLALNNMWDKLPEHCKIRKSRKSAARMVKFAAKNQLGYFWSPYHSDNLRLIDWLDMYYYRESCLCTHCEANKMRLWMKISSVEAHFADIDRRAASFAKKKETEARIKEEKQKKALMEFEKKKAEFGVEREQGVTEDLENLHPKWMC